MSPLKCSSYQLKALFSQCPIKIGVITVVVLCALQLTTVFAAQEGVTFSSFLSNPTTRHSLPSDTLTGHQQSSRVSRVTKAASQGGTTSTVRPWPSHGFFRSVLSKSDNVVAKKRNGSTSTRRKNRKHSKNASSAHQEGLNHSNANPIYNGADMQKSAANRKKLDKKEQIEKSQIKSDGNNTRARSVAITGVLVAETASSNSNNNNNNSKVVSQRKFPLQSEEREPKITGKLKLHNEQTENVTNLSQPENSTLKEMKRVSHEYSYVNGPQVGFQYEIVMPSPSTTAISPRPSSSLTSSKAIVSIPSNHKPTPAAISTTLHAFYSIDNSGSSNDADDDDGSENNRNTSNSTISAVTVNDTRIRVTNDDTPTTTPLPSGSQFEHAETGEAAAAASLLPPPPSPTLRSSYNKSNEMISPNLENTSSLLLSPPTHQQQPPLQLLDVLLEKGNGENITFNNKSHLPHSLKEGPGYLEKNLAEIHTEIRKTDPWTINHNSGNADMSNKGSLVAETFTFLPPSPVLKRGHKRNSSSSVNSLITLDTTIATAATFTMRPFNIAHASTPLPTHQQKSSPISSVFQQIQRKGTSRFKVENANNSFQKRTPHRGEHNRRETNTGKMNYISTSVQKQDRDKINHTTALMNRRNMFTVVKGDIINPKIHIESRNTTTKSRTKATTEEVNRKSGMIKSGLPKGNPIDTLLNDQTNQVERPSLTTSILTGPDRMLFSSTSPPLPEFTQKDNDYFDEDDAQANLHHWIESEQGHFVTPSTELPRFTNLTWPYYFPKSDANAHENSQGNWATKTGGNGNSAGAAGASASTALDVSIKSKRKGKPNLDFNSEYEFYIPSAAADPNQNPLLLAKRPTNKTGQVNYETWTRIPTVQASALKPYLQSEKQQDTISNVEPSDHKSKIKHSHWGSNGLSILKPQNLQKVTNKPHNTPTPLVKQGEVQQNKIKGYESSPGTPKSSSSIFSPTRSPASTTFTVFKHKNQNHFFTSPPSLLGGTWPFDGGSVMGQSETASFITPKTPTNIWYKPTINHFTAAVPFNGTSSLFENVNDRIFNRNAYGNGGAEGTILTTTTQTSSPTQQIYVGEDNDDDDVTLFVNSKKDKAIPGKIQNSSSHEKNSTILFKVWNLVDGKLKLENQREIPAWALQGYLIPTSGTILNLQQIPPALQPLVTSAMAMNKETEEYSVNNATNSLPYVWKPLPILGGFNVATTFSSIVTPTPPSTTTTTGVATSPITPDESLFDNDYDQIKYPSNSNNMGWEATKEVMHSKQPVSINYVLWNNLAPIYGQSIIPSTPTPTQTPLSRLPTPVSYFPSSTITLGENTPPPQYYHPSVVTIKHPGSTSNGNPTSYITTTTPRTGLTNSMSQEKLELLFQNYFQYFITTSTPATKTTTTTTTALPISLANTVTQTYGQQSDNTKAWQDLKKLILRLAATKNGSSDNQASDTPDNDKTEDLEYLGNVAAIALIMSYLRNQYENGSTAATTITKLHSNTTTTAPYGITDDMTPPHKDQLWATVYPLFQHFLNNPNYTFIPPPPPHSSNQQLLSETSSLLSSMTPTSPGPIPFTEPLTGTGSAGSTESSNYYSLYNHYASYYPTITTPQSSKLSHISITEVPRRGATTEQTARSEETFDEVDDFDYKGETSTTTDKSKTLLLLKKLKKKDKKHAKKKVKSALLGAALLKKISGPLFGVVKKPKKYWFDLKFEVDFVDILKKKLLYMLALNYMPVVLVLALGVTPLALSLVPLVYKIWWTKWRKPKYIKVKVPYPSPYPVPVYKPQSFHYNRHYGSHSPVHEQLQRPDIRYNYDDEQKHNDDVIKIDSPTAPMIFDHHHHYESDTLGNGAVDDNGYDPTQYVHKKSQLHDYQVRSDHPARVLNSFNYDYARHSSTTPNTHAGNIFQQYSYPQSHSNNQQDDEEIHVHLHDEESRPRPLFQQPPPTYSPSDYYTSYTKKDLQPYPVTYQMGFDIGKAIAGITNKNDMEIFKILVETKKEKLSKLLEMWNLAKYGAAVASEAAMNAIRGPTTPLYPDIKHEKKKRKRRKRRRKRKHSNEFQIPSTINPNATTVSPN